MNAERDVAQPLLAVLGERAGPAKPAYRRNLPHLQRERCTLFVTFRTHKRWILPESVRGLVLDHCLDDHGVRLLVHGAVVMPNHVHMVFSPLSDEDGVPYGLAQIMKGIKGSAARSVNRALKRQGHVWQDESFDHILRSNEGVRQKVEYICQNPVRRGLARTPDEYPWLWRQWVEGERSALTHRGAVQGTGKSACATSGDED